MSQNQDLKRLAKKTYMSYHQDGLVDLLIGWMIIAFAAMMAFDFLAFPKPIAIFLDHRS